MTRNPNSEKASRLKELGVEVVQGDLWDVPSLKNAMNGAEGVFGVTFVSFTRNHESNCPSAQVTDYYDTKNIAQGPTSEMILGKNLVDAAVAAGVKFFVWR